MKFNHIFIFLFPILIQSKCDLECYDKIYQKLMNCSPCDAIQTKDSDQQARVECDCIGISLCDLDCYHQTFTNIMETTFCPYFLGAPSKFCGEKAHRLANLKCRCTL
ncbi:hypothetical protein BC833DRAFT_600103 [Globomyces pollinis-pini]|nr:hypothetical protein BC833DRAFT_600103 [Globomyces pollinis-pini]